MSTARATTISEKKMLKPKTDKLEVEKNGKCQDVIFRDNFRKIAQRFSLFSVNVTIRQMAWKGVIM